MAEVVQTDRAVGEEGQFDPVGAVLGPQGAGRSAARVREGRGLVGEPDPVGLLELRGRQQHLAAQLDVDRPGEDRRQTEDGVGGVGDVLAGQAVAAGEDLNEPATPVPGGHREAVELRLHAPSGHGVSETPFQAGGPLGELVGVEDVVEGEHRHRVRHVALHGPARHLPGRRLGQHLVRVGLLVGRDGAQQPVVLVVAERGGPVAVVRGRRRKGGGHGLRVGGGREQGTVFGHEGHDAARH